MILYIGKLNDRMETLPEDSEAVHGFGMTLGSLLLKAALQADWKCEMVEDDALWLIGFVSSETRPYTVSGLLRTLNPDTLMSAKEILTYLKDNDSTDRTLSDIRLRYYAAHGNELCWRYPICDGIHAGAFILATKDGYRLMQEDSGVIAVGKKADFITINLRQPHLYPHGPGRVRVLGGLRHRLK